MPFSLTGYRRVCAAAMVVLLTAAGSAAAQSTDAFQQGLDAYLDGDYAKAMELWRPAAESGDPVAAFNVGVLHAQGLGVEADPEEALKWYRQSALDGYANAQFNLGAAYYNGEGTETNVSQALSWWEKAAEQDHPEALYNLGALYRDGRFVEQDVERARALLERAAAAGDARAGEALAELGGPDSGPEDPEDREPTATTADVPAAEAEPETADSGGAETAQNDSAPQADVSNDSEGWPANVNPEHWAVQVFAVAKRDAAQRFIKEHDLAGRVRVFEAEVHGETWFKGVAGNFADANAAKEAQNDLEEHLGGASLWIRPYRAIQEEAVGEMDEPAAAPPDTTGSDQAAVEEEEDAPPVAASEDDIKDLEEAERAAAQNAEDKREPILTEMDDAAGAAEPVKEEPAEAPRMSDDRRAALRAGQRAFNRQNYEAALDAWRPLAEQGVADAQYGIGFMYESGWGVEEDFSQAFRWYQLAAQQGHVQSQYNLGMLYREGKGVARNDALGLYWIQTAADGGDERALNYLQNLN